MQPKKLAVKLLLRQQIRSIDTDLFRLDCRNHIVLDSIQHFSQCVNRDPHDFIGEGANDCVVIPRRGRYLILYNDWILSSARKRWSIAHEIGHICCGHTTDDPLQEAQANIFASELLIPEIVLQEAFRMGLVCTAQDIASLFHVSLQAAQNQMESLECSKTFGELDRQLLQKYIPVLKKRVVEPIISIPYRNFQRDTITIL